MLAEINLPISYETTSTFKTKTPIMNLIAIAMFFDKICKAILNHLFTTGSNMIELFEPLSTYFRTVETNGMGMLHFYCLVWL